MLPMLRVVRVIIPVIRSAGQGGNATASPILGINPGIARVLTLMLVFVYTCHWIGCVWWTVGELEQDGLIATVQDSVNHTAPRFDPHRRDTWGPSTWLRETQHPVTQYAHSFLWGASLMTGFVPFDVVPNTLMEVLVTVLALFFGLMVNTAIISSTTSALQSISVKSSHVVDKMEKIAQYMRHKHVPADLSCKINAFYDYQLSPHRSGAGGHDLAELPPVLAMELIMHTHQDLFRECPIFHLIPPPTALSLVERFEPIVYVPDEIIIHEGAQNGALFVINRGLVTVWKKDAAAPNSKKVLTTLTDNDFFGEQTLLKTISLERGSAEPVQANATCQSASYCDMFRLTSTDFIAVLDQARSRCGSWANKDITGMISTAANERNSRADVDRQRKRSLMWAATQVRRKNQEKASSARRRSTSEPFRPGILRRRLSNGRLFASFENSVQDRRHALPNLGRRGHDVMPDSQVDRDARESDRQGKGRPPSKVRLDLGAGGFCAPAGYSSRASSQPNAPSCPASILRSTSCAAAGMSCSPGTSVGQATTSTRCRSTSSTSASSSSAGSHRDMHDQEHAHDLSSNRLVAAVRECVPGLIPAPTPGHAMPMREDSDPALNA